MKVIYQVGKHRLHLYHPGLSHESNYETRYESTELFNSPYFIPQVAPWKFKKLGVKVSGRVVSLKNQIKAEQIAQSLRGQIDQINDVIAYEVVEDDVIWLHNFGIVRSAEVGRSDVYDSSEVNLELDLLSFWEPINQLLWYFGSAPEDPMEPYTPSSYYLGYLSPLPNPAKVFDPKSRDVWMWVKRNFDNHEFLFDPYAWETLYTPGVSHALSWTNGGWFTADISDLDWGAPPHVLYAFKDLPQTGEVTLQVLRERGWGRDEEEITIDLAQLDSDLNDAGFTELKPTDIVIIGDVTRLPGYVIRQGETLDFSPNVSYTSDWPGFLNPGKNRFFIDPAGGTTAYQIIPRKL